MESVRREIRLMNPSIYCLPGKAIYAKIPAKELRNCVDKLFPKLHIDPIADCQAGVGHRWAAGHDILLDVPKTFKMYGPKRALHQLGHILLTDFPTKQGIPIPGFSKSGLGGFLYAHGVKMTSMCINLCDASVGILCFNEATNDLFSAFSGNMHMDFMTFLDTYVEGGAELYAGIVGHNKLLVTSGWENLMSGVVTTWKEITDMISPLELLGPSLTAMIIGYFCSKTIGGQSQEQSVINAGKSGLLSCLFQISPVFSYGVGIGFLFMELAKNLAKKNMSEAESLSEVSLQSFKNYVASLIKFDKSLAELPFLREFYEIIRSNSSAQIEDFLKEIDKLKLEKKSTSYSLKYNAEDYLVSYLENDYKLKFDCLSLDVPTFPLKYDKPKLNVKSYKL